MAILRTVPESMPVIYPEQFMSIPQEWQRFSLKMQDMKRDPHAATPDIVRWALSRIDQTALRVERNEDGPWLSYIANEAQGIRNAQDTDWVVPHAIGVCTWGDEDKLKILGAQLRHTPHLSITAVTNFPDSDLNAAQSSQNIHGIAGALTGIQNPRNVETVIDYLAWIKGDEARVHEKLTAEREAANRCGLGMLVIQKANIHSVSEVKTPWDSLYESTRLSLNIGVHGVTTCTGMRAQPPYHTAVSQDIVAPQTMLPMLVALRDHIRTTSDTPFAKISGGQRSEQDAAMIYHMIKEVLGEDALDTVVIGADPVFRRRLIQYLHTHDPKSGVTHDMHAWPERSDNTSQQFRKNTVLGL